MPPTERPTILAINLGEDFIEITYTEVRDLSRSAMIIRTLRVSRDVSLVPEALAELVDAALTIIDAGLLAIRAPEDRFSRATEPSS